MSSSAALPNLPASSSDNASNAQQTSASASASASSQQSASASNSRQTASVSSASGLPQIGASSTATSSSSISGITNAPTLTSSDSGPVLSLTGLPTLSGAYSYPPASVPPTQNAPYMRQSQLPQNFVFIIVGAVLALILVLVVLWRSLTAWSVNRSFKKDSAAAYTPLPDMKKRQSGHMKNETMVDMADLSGSNTGGAKLPKSFNSVPSLFFSPTAEVARQSMIRPQSQHMPSGHYRDGSK